MPDSPIDPSRLRSLAAALGGSFPWTCPFCNRDTTIIRDRQSRSAFVDLTIPNSDGGRRLRVTFIVCPNPKCAKFTLHLSLFELAWSSTTQKHEITRHEPLDSWELIPESRARAFPDYIPEAILNDYNEACLIVEKSPKASATLSRRCLQGIIRDFWQVNGRNLAEEIGQIRDRVDSSVWDSIEAVRTVGNIGAHMEKDIDLIIEVEPEEAGLLISLIEILLKEWYIARKEREQRLEAITKLAQNKSSAKKTGKGDSAPSGPT